jgi:hypothetical protein
VVVHARVAITLASNAASLKVVTPLLAQDFFLRGKARLIQQKTSAPECSSDNIGSKRDLLPNYSLRRELIHLYFHHVHGKHHSLFHQPSVERELEDGQVPDILLYAMMSLGARYLCCGVLLTLY